jgi:hypothetical protein
MTYIEMCKYRYRQFSTSTGAEGYRYYPVP